MDPPRSLRDHLPLGLAILCATTLVILFLMTGSVLLADQGAHHEPADLSAAVGLHRRVGVTA